MLSLACFSIKINICDIILVNHITDIHIGTHITDVYFDGKTSHLEPIKDIISVICVPI
jgi:hypothetical protein